MDTAKSPPVAGRPARSAL